MIYQRDLSIIDAFLSEQSFSEFETTENSQEEEEEVKKRPSESRACDGQTDRRRGRSAAVGELFVWSERSAGGASDDHLFVF